MSTDATNLLDAALHLSDDDRANLAYHLLRSLRPPGILNEDSSLFEKQIEERLARFESGQSSAADWEEVSNRLRDALHE